MENHTLYLYDRPNPWLIQYESNGWIEVFVRELAVVGRVGRAATLPANQLGLVVYTSITQAQGDDYAVCRIYFFACLSFATLPVSSATAKSANF